MQAPQPIKLKKEVIDRTEAAASDAEHSSMPVLAAGGRLSGSLGNVSNLHAQHQQQQQAVSSNADRRQLVEMLRLITSGEGVPTSTRQRLADAVLGLFDQRHHVISHLLQVCACHTLYGLFKPFFIKAAADSNLDIVK